MSVSGIYPTSVKVDETWLFIEGVKRPMAVVLDPKGERLDLRLSGPGFDSSRSWPRARYRELRPTTTRSTPGSGDSGSGPATVRRAHAAHRETAYPGYRRRRPAPPGPGPAADPATPGPRTTAGGGTSPAGTLGGGDAGLCRSAAGGAEAVVAPLGTPAQLGMQPREPQGARLHHPVGELVWQLQALDPPDTGTEDRGRGFVRLIARSMA
ncbi:MAG: hypothetical protein F4X16_12465 [Caldilineaceae bacterium SB0661_bin_34]|nr:hypothetical protein [Caldilineaceae bacterium SB0661_bin_34]